MIVDSEKEYDIEKVYFFNKLMVDTIKINESQFEFDGKYYSVSSDGVCVQTLINDRILYHIFIEDHKDNILISY